MTLSTSAPERLLFVVLTAAFCLLSIAYFGVSTWLMGAIVVVIFGQLWWVYGLEYLHPTVAFVTPWLAIVGFSMVPISQNARQLAPATYELVLGVILIWMAFGVGAPVRGERRRGPGLQTAPDSPQVQNLDLLTAGFVILYLLAALNVLVSGYIPLFELFLTGDSLYADFGIPSVYGFFFAYANAIACLAFYAYLKSGRKGPLLFYLSVIAIHLLFVTRQHLLTLLLESFIIRCFTKAPISQLRMMVIAITGLVALNFLGELRTGDIRETIHIADEYQWLPGAAAWLYAYSYFNVLNLENTMAVSDAPYFDGTMLQTILPSVLRPEFAHAAIFEIPALNILSYIYPIYLDIGLYGVLIFTAVIAWLTARVYRRALTRRRFGAIASYAFFYYSAILSFFTPFWLYLPVVFQVVFFRAFEFLFFPPPGQEKRPLDTAADTGIRPSSGNEVASG